MTIFQGLCPDIYPSSPKTGDVKGANHLNLLKVFGRAFYKKLVGGLGGEAPNYLPPWRCLMQKRNFGLVFSLTNNSPT